MTLLLMDDLKKTASECGEVRVVVTTSSLHDPETKGMGGTVRLTHIFPFLPIYVGFLKKNSMPTSSIICLSFIELIEINLVHASFECEWDMNFDVTNLQQFNITCKNNPVTSMLASHSQECEPGVIVFLRKYCCHN